MLELPSEATEAKRRRIQVVASGHHHSDEVVMLSGLQMPAEIDPQDEVGYPPYDDEQDVMRSSDIPEVLWRPDVKQCRAIRFGCCC